jgi:hypothetical protein
MLSGKLSNSTYQNAAETQPYVEIRQKDTEQYVRVYGNSEEDARAKALAINDVLLLVDIHRKERAE